MIALDYYIGSDIMETRDTLLKKVRDTRPTPIDEHKYGYLIFLTEDEKVALETLLQH